MQRKPKTLSINIEKGTVAELRDIMNNIPKIHDNLQVWLGSDSGEGYTTLRSVLINNSKFCDLDGDEACGVAYTHFNSDPEEDIIEEKDIPAEYTFLAPGFEGAIEAYKDIFILGDRFAEDYITQCKKDYTKSLKEEAKKANMQKDVDYIEYLRLKSTLEKRFGDLIE